jgi:biopolymer transport protein ExbD
MKKDNQECELDMTPMIDVVFLLIIFFILMPPKDKDWIIDAYLPSDRDGVKKSEDVKFFIRLKAQEVGQDVKSKIYFNNIYICEFKTLSITTLNEMYDIHKKSNKPNDELLTRERERDKVQFDPIRSDGLRKLMLQMDDALLSYEVGKDVDVLIQSDGNVPFKVVMALLNAGKGGEYKNIKFAAPSS